MHLLLTDTKFVQISGTRVAVGVRAFHHSQADAVELPSTLFERFADNADLLAAINETSRKPLVVRRFQQPQDGFSVSTVSSSSRRFFAFVATSRLSEMFVPPGWEFHPDIGTLRVDRRSVLRR